MSCYPRNYIGTLCVRVVLTHSYIHMLMMLCVCNILVRSVLVRTWMSHTESARRCSGRFVSYIPALSCVIMLMMLCVTGRLWMC